MASHFNVNPERWREWAAFRHELGEDTYAARTQVTRRGSSQLNRRTFVRALFAEIEGTINHLKNDALDTQSSLFNPAELAMLRDETYGVDGQGNAHTQLKFVRIENNLLFALRSYLRY